MEVVEKLTPAVSSLDGTATRLTLDLARLNIVQKSRASRLPWKGQFSPELIEYLLDVFSKKDDLVLDPFSGSGTVMFECQERGLPSIGVDVNPAAFLLSKASSFARYDKYQRKALIAEASNVVYQLPEIALTKGGSPEAAQALDLISNAVMSAQSKELLELMLMLGISDKRVITPLLLKRGVSLASAFLNDLAHSATAVESHLGDARYLPANCIDIDLVITSPPYINVFNYHQNYRAVLEFLGWMPLKSAVTEIGANRKHRQNRLLTVIQYCLDMYLSIVEMARVLKRGGKLILVVGRSSAVLGNDFYNSEILSKVIAASGKFRISVEASRVFRNRFGVEIVEDVLVATREDVGEPVGLEGARVIGVSALDRALQSRSVRNPSLVEEAINFSSNVTPSAPLGNHF